jgi:hypothetical protein
MNAKQQQQQLLCRRKVGLKEQESFVRISWLSSFAFTIFESVFVDSGLSACLLGGS